MDIVRLEDLETWAGCQQSDPPLFAAHVANEDSAAGIRNMVFSLTSGPFISAIFMQNEVTSSSL
jgi:hypothetical protein